MTDFGGLRILVVDDDPMMIDLLSRLLVRAGATAPRSASDGRAALDDLDASETDLIFCDIDMPGMDGVEFLRYLRDRPFPPAVVVLSSTPDSIRESVEKLGLAHQLRILGSLPKPASLDSVTAMLSRFLETPSPRDVAPGGYFTLSAGDVIGLLSTSIEVHYQPVHNARTGRVVGLEALSRLRHPTFGLVGPIIFVPVCEKAGASTQLLRVVLAEALKQLAQFHADGYPNLTMAVNMSSADLTIPDLVGEITTATTNAGVPTTSVILELTESQALHDTTLPTEILTRLRVRGLGLAVDDFGTGYASLKQLAHIPFTELKIDQTFVRGANTDSRKRSMLESTVGLAHELSLTTVAEGVETAAEHDLIRGLGCDFIQGFYLSKPMPLAELRVFLAENAQSTPAD